MDTGDGILKVCPFPAGLQGLADLAGALVATFSAFGLFGFVRCWGASALT